MSKDIIRYTSCGYHCLNMCILKVRIRDGVIVAVEPDDTVNPGIPREDAYLAESVINTGMVQIRPCVKGYAQATHMIYDPKRVRYPMKRVGQRGEAKFERISWDEALDTIAQKLIETKNNFGPYSIMHQPYSNFSKSSFPLAPWFGAGFAGWDSHSANGWMEPEHWVLGREYEKAATGPTGLAASQDEVNVLKSKLIVLWGLNPLTTFNGGFIYNLIRAREKGIPIIVIDSRYTPSAEVLADQWIPIRPTTDVAMMIAMANVWFKENLCDNEFIQKWVEPEGLKKWRAYVQGTSDGIDKTPRWAETICGVPAETIEAFARLYARGKPVNLSVSFGIGRQFFGENPARASMYLQALTGNTCIPGGTAAAETGIFRARPIYPMPAVDWQKKPGTYNPPVLVSSYKWMKAIDIREKLDKGIISKEAYNNAIGNAPQNPCPDIRFVMVESNNHANSLPDINGNIRAMKKIDFFVVFSHYAENNTARYADILLPQIHTAYEGRNCQCVSQSRDLFKRGMYLANYWLYRQKCIDPPGEIKSNDWFWVQMAKRLGMAEQYNPRLAHVSDDVWDEVIEGYHREAFENWAKLKEIAPLNPPTWDNFQEKPVFRYEINDPHYPFKEDMEAGSNPFAGTESGKIEFYSKGLAQGPRALAAKDFFPGKCYGGGNLPPMAQMTVGGKDNFYSQDSKKYPLLMSSPHSMYRVHSLLDNNTWLRGDCYRHAVWMSVADAKARNLVDGDTVRIYNDLAEMVLPVYVTSRVVPCTVYIFHGSWYQPGKEKTELMPDGIDMGGAPNFLTHNEDVPDTVIGFLPCKGLVQVEQWEGK